MTARASAALADVELRAGRIAVREAPGDQAIDQGVWFFSGQRAVEAPRVAPAVDAAARRAALRPRRFTQAPALDLAMYAERVRGARPPATVVVSTSVGPDEASAKRALVGSLVLGLLTLAGVLAAVRLAVNAALRPVDRMTAEAAAWSVEDVEHRFADVGAHDELARLASTFNDLLARISASLRHEQRFSAELSHELRTPLAKLIVEAELALRRDRAPAEYRAALESVARDARQMQTVVETLLAVARSEIDPRSGTANAEEVAARAIAAAHGSADRVELTLTPSPAPLRLGVDPELAERALAPVLANALKFAATKADVSLRADGTRVDFVVRDDGAGVPVDEREAIFSPGARGSGAPERPSGVEGTGLGLALARRLARAVGGDVVCQAGSGTTEFVVSLPRA